MEQQQIKVGFPVGTKLLISVVLLVSIVIFFLTVSTILLFREDKRAYVYQSQSTDALVIGNEIVSKAKPSIDLLRTSLTAIEPGKEVTANQNAFLKSILD